VWSAAPQQWIGTFSGMMPTGKNVSDLISLATVVGVEYDEEINACCQILDQGFMSGFAEEFKKRNK
jgi:hypothetical protein